jgi:CotH kinase protein
MKPFAIFPAALIVSAALSSAAQVPFGGPLNRDLKIVKQFDKNNDGWLNTVERKAAREYMNSQGISRRGFRPGPRGFDPNGSAPQRGKTIKPADVKTYPTASFYDETVLRTLFMTFDDADWEKELEDFHGTDVDVPATLLIDGKTYHDVGIHFRGMSSYSGVPEGRKRSLNVSIDMAHAEQNAGGYRTLNLLNSHEDPTFMRAVLFLHVARQYIPAPKANFVRVVINGENWGVYASVQQFNKDFLKENFRESSGTRWKVPGPNPQGGLSYLGENVETYKRNYEIKTKEDPASWAALINLTRTLNQTPTGQLDNALSSILDVDGALRFLALDNGLVNNDGYWTRASDYSIYRDEAGKFHLIPHDTNETFAASMGFGPRGFPPPPPPTRRFVIAPQRRGFGGPIGGPMGLGGANLDPLIGLDDSGKPLRSKLLSVPANREKYLGYVKEIATKWLDWKTLGPLVEQYKSLIDADVQLDTKKLYSYEAFQSGLDGPSNSLKSFAADRSKFLLR